MISFCCEKVLLQGAVNLAGRAVSPKSSIPALEGLLLEADTGITLSGYNMNTGIRSSIPAEVESKGRVVLSARLCSDIVRRMPDNMISVKVSDNLRGICFLAVFSELFSGMSVNRSCVQYGIGFLVSAEHHQKI